ncbi:MAG: hypothetical protein QM504_15940 [Pseudomonadota bacterium]
MKLYTIYFTGEAQQHIKIGQLKENLCLLFKTDLSRIEKMFIGKPVIVKKAISAEKVKKYQQALIKAGAKVVIKEDIKETFDQHHEQSNDPAVNKEQASDNNSNEQMSSGLAGLINYNQKEESATKSSQLETSPMEDKNADAQISEDKSEHGLTMSLPNTGSLEEFSNQEEVFNEPDLSAYSIDDTNMGSFEKYVKKVVAVEIGDISYMDITDQNDRPLSDQTIKPKAVVIPDTENLNLLEANTGSLEEFVIHPDEYDMEKISDLQLENK